MTKWWEAQVKGEGQIVGGYEYDTTSPKHVVETTWIEFSLPSAWEDECWAMIEQWLKDKREKEKNK